MTIIIEDLFRVAENKGFELDLELLNSQFRIENESKYFLRISKNVNLYEDICLEYNPILPLLDQPESTLVQLISLFK